MSNTGQFGGFMGRKAGEKSNFSLTCGLLSQYLKEKGSFGDLGLVMSRPVEVQAKPEPQRTMNLFPGIAAAAEAARIASEAARSASTSAVPTKPAELYPQRTASFAPSAPTSESQKKREPKAAQMTMFYGGKVIVFDDFPANKAEELMAMAIKGIPFAANLPAIPPAAPVALPKPLQSFHAPPPRVVASSTAPSGNKPVPVYVAAQDHPQAPAQKPPLPIGSDLPIARRNSLNRFLEKRKGRFSSLAPYQVNGQDAPTSSSDTAPSNRDEKEKEKQPWFGPSSSGPSRSEEKTPWYSGLGSAAATSSRSEEMQPWLGLAPMSSSSMELPESPEQHQRR